ncbi:Xylulose kinase [Sodalis praecaptivus]|uniref:Xylulose kinase n=1 Tax=Sodalis praecaptivus TaxID=1239307 RepID=W0I0Y7_9GAMM|nr:xylulokinase [Sodalis praecaptivus]AHF78113.1 Xylulose kinase [Sodalis praecaptivus]
MALFAGIDCGTQGTKVVIVDDDSGRILGEGSAPHPLISDASGRREQQAQWWVDALMSAFKRAVDAAAVNPADIQGLAVSGQQHGFVALDAAGDVLHTVKLWCDTETAPENDWLLEQLGGISGSLARLGLMVATGYTASKIVWFKQHHPELWQRLATVLLPHDYLNFWLTGQRVAEYGDASGSGLFDIRNRCWDRFVVDRIDSSGRLWRALPPLVSAETCIGGVTAAAAERLGLTPGTPVASGGGDNMMAAIGTGNIQPGILTMSLGTSGTLFACADAPVVADSEMIAGFCSSTNGWLPLICTMNVTSASGAVQKLLDMDVNAFNRALGQAEPGAGGMLMLPFFNGERVPQLPAAKASLHNLDADNFTAANLCLAVVESATYGLRFGMDLFRQQGIAVTEIRLTGGGARSARWRQIVADVMNCPVVCPVEKEAAALGAAIQAIWSVRVAQQPQRPAREQLQALCERFVHLDEDSRCRPDPARQQRYGELYPRYLRLLQHEYEVGL